MRRPTIKDVAERACVSGWTVSKVLNGNKDAAIAAATRERVLEAAAHLGYTPNRAARALVQGRTHLVALWVISNECYSPYFGRLQFSVEQCAHEHSYQCLTEGVPLQQAHGGDWSSLLSWPVDGILACDVAGPAEAYALADVPGQPPLVSFGVWCVTRVDHVRVDLYPGSVQAVEHLLRAGCRRVAFVGPPQHDDRARAYENVVCEAGRKPEFIHTPANSRAAVRETVRAHIEVNGRPDGLFCQNDDRAIAAIRALHDLGLRVPEDVAVVGCDGIEDAEFANPSVSTIAVPIAEVCAAAWQLLERRMSDPRAPLQHRCLQPQLVVRGSSCR